MNASRLPESTPADERPPPELVPGPVARQHVERRLFGLPARYTLLVLACAAFGAAIGLFATASWAWGVVALLLALIFFATLAEGLRQGRGLWPEQSGRLAADGKAQAATAAEVWRTRLETSVSRWRTQSRLAELDFERTPLLQALGRAVHEGDEQAERDARLRLDELDEERRRVERELAERLSGAEERIRLARLPVQETLMVAPNEPSSPYPPPDEGNPPQPARMPEPYPPPDEGTPPVPAPDPGEPDGE
ncbi:MAG TPA: hypothetical protein VFA37_09525 [Gaiellaceae bacterium]|nr:hypothetical protein [Gaiellaceae bacterium]